MHEIKIYGEIIPFQDASLIEKGFCNLSHVQMQLKEAKGIDIIVRINSPGGDVDEGFVIYSELRRYARENKVKVITLAEGRCQSIATIIFLAGDERVLTEHTDPFVHNAWTYAMGDNRAITKMANELESCNDKIAKHYELHTNLTYDEARELMNEETSISAEEAVKLKFATRIEEVLRPKALMRALNNNTKLNKMSKQKNKKRVNSFKAKLMTLFEGFSNKIVLDAASNEVDFYDLSDDDVISIGDMANIDGEPAEGEVVMTDGSTYVFSAGELIEIIASSALEGEDVVIEEIQQEVTEQAEVIEDLEIRISELEDAIQASYTLSIKSVKAMKKQLSETKIKQVSAINKLRNLSKIESKIGITEKKNKPSNQKETESRFKKAASNLTIKK